MNKKILGLALLLSLNSIDVIAGSGDAVTAASTGALSVAGAATSLYLTEFDAGSENAALLSESELKTGDFAAQFMYRYISIDVRGNSGTSSRMYQNDANTVHLPSFGLFYRLNDKIVLGGGTYSLTASGVDFKDVSAKNNAEGNVVSIRANLVMSYRLNNDWSIGGGPLIYYLMAENNYGSGSNKTDNDGGSDTQFGFHLGAYGNLTDKDHLGVTYSRGATATIDDYTDFDALNESPDNVVDSVEIGIPDEFSLGYTRDLAETVKLVFDYRYIAWSQAEFYKDLGWNDSHVFGVATQIKVGQALDWRFGFNYGDVPVPEKSGESGGSSAKLGRHTVKQWGISQINAGGHNIAKWRFTTGATYKIKENLKFLFAYMYEGPNEISISGSGATYLGGDYRFKSFGTAQTLDLTIDYTF